MSRNFSDLSPGELAAEFEVDQAASHSSIREIKQITQNNLEGKREGRGNRGNRIGL
jgi:predicted DNA-binding protein YlxM (UPF0122 family)